MSNTSKGRATKGSKLMIQLAASPLQKHIIDEKLGEELVWLSPIEDTDYKEYQMSETEVCNASRQGKCLHRMRRMRKPLPVPSPHTRDAQKGCRQLR